MSRCCRQAERRQHLSSIRPGAQGPCRCGFSVRSQEPREPGVTRGRAPSRLWGSQGLPDMDPRSRAGLARVHRQPWVQPMGRRVRLVARAVACPPAPAAAASCRVPSGCSSTVGELPGHPLEFQRHRALRLGRHGLKCLACFAQPSHPYQAWLKGECSGEEPVGRLPARTLAAMRRARATREVEVPAVLAARWVALGGGPLDGFGGAPTGLVGSGGVAAGDEAPTGPAGCGGTAASGGAPTGSAGSGGTVAGGEASAGPAGCGGTAAGAGAPTGPAGSGGTIAAAAGDGASTGFAGSGGFAAGGGALTGSAGHGDFVEGGRTPTDRCGAAAGGGAEPVLVLGAVVPAPGGQEVEPTGAVPAALAVGAVGGRKSRGKRARASSRLGG